MLPIDRRRRVLRSALTLGWLLTPWLLFHLGGVNLTRSDIRFSWLVTTFGVHWHPHFGLDLVIPLLTAAGLKVLRRWPMGAPASTATFGVTYASIALTVGVASRPHDERWLLDNYYLLALAMVVAVLSLSGLLAVVSLRFHQE